MSTDFFLDVFVVVVFFVFVFFPLASLASVVVLVVVEALDFAELSCAKASVESVRGRTNIPVKSNVVSFFMLIVSSIVGVYYHPSELTMEPIAQSRQ